MSVFFHTPLGRLRRLTRDGKVVYALRCPGCGVEAVLDDDQLHGRVSVDHAADGCPGGYHETHEFTAAIEQVEPTIT